VRVRGVEEALVVGVWPVCGRCGERPVEQRSKSAAPRSSGLCSSCRWQVRKEAGYAAPPRVSWEARKRAGYVAPARGGGEAGRKGGAGQRRGPGAWRYVAAVGELPASFAEPGCGEHREELLALVVRWRDGERWDQPAALGCGCRCWVGAQAVVRADGEGLV